MRNLVINVSYPCELQVIGCMTHVTIRVAIVHVTSYDMLTVALRDTNSLHDPINLSSMVAQPSIIVMHGG